MYVSIIPWPFNLVHELYTLPNLHSIRSGCCLCLARTNQSHLIALWIRFGGCCAGSADHGTVSTHQIQLPCTGDRGQLSWVLRRSHVPYNFRCLDLECYEISMANRYSVLLKVVAHGARGENAELLDRSTATNWNCMAETI